MKILTIVHALEKGGVARTAQIFAEGYQVLGIDSRVLAINHGGPREEDLLLKKIPFWIGTDNQTVREIMEWNPDALHIHSHGFNLQENPFLVELIKNRTVVEKNIFSRPVAWTHQMDYSYQMSSWCLWRFCTTAPQLASKAIVIPNAAVTAAFAKASADEILEFRKQHNIPEQALVIGRIGQLYETKWSPVLIQAFNRLSQKYEHLHLLLVNPSERIIKQAHASPFRSRITIIDYILGDKPLSVAYSATDIFALAADQGESFGNVLAEAMLCEVPIVTLSTPWGDNSQCEVTGHNEGGLIALSPKGFRRALKTLIDDPALRERLGTTGRKRIIERYDYLKVAQQSLDIIQNRPHPPEQKKLDQQIIEIYRNSFDRPSPLTLFLLRKKKFLRMTRYTTHYEPLLYIFPAMATVLMASIRQRLSKKN